MAATGISHHPLHCIIPPVMLESMKLRGDTKVRAMAADLEKQGEAYRSARMAAVPSLEAMAVRRRRRSTRTRPNREVYDAKNGSGLPGTLVRDESTRASKDKAVNDAFNGAGDTFNLFWRNYDRNSLDGDGMTIVSTVHFRRNYNNAFWNGEQMAYGDGDGSLFKAFTGDRTVIGHELSHGVVQFSGGLIYSDESGALNESFADVFGALSVQYKKRQSPGEADWLIGADILGPDLDGIALRSMKAPGTAYDDPLIGSDPQPYHMDFYVNTREDRGGVHINSGIPNHAFYLLANYMGDAAWEKPGKIWYETMQKINNPNATFPEWADTTVMVAADLFGMGSIEQRYTRRAWKLVGISV